MIFMANHSGLPSSMILAVKCKSDILNLQQKKRADIIITIVHILNGRLYYSA